MESAGGIVDTTFDQWVFADSLAMLLSSARTHHGILATWTHTHSHARARTGLLRALLLRHCFRRNRLELHVALRLDVLACLFVLLERCCAHTQSLRKRP